MKFTAHLIALNEGQIIAAALSSLKGFADEIIVVDGGSTDDTVKIAKSFGAKVVVHPWNNHFAESRNAAFPLTTGDWVLILDCDETLEAGSGDILKRAAHEGKHPVYFVTRLQTTPQGATYETRIPRLGIMGPDKHFVYRVHEQLRPEIVDFGFTNARIIHRPCPPHLRRPKLEHYLKLLELEIAEHAGKDLLYYRTERVHTRRELGYPDWHKGLAEALQMMDCTRPRPPSGQPAILMECAMLAPPAALPVGMRHLALVEVIDRWFPNNVVLNGMAAWRLHEAARYRECIQHGERAILLYRSGNYDKSHGFNPAFIDKQLAMTLADAKMRIARQAMNVDFSQIVPPKP